MRVEQRASAPQPKHRIDPMEKLMDDLGLPREAKYDLMDAYIDSLTDKAVNKLFEDDDVRKNLPRGPLGRPRVSWDTVQDAIYIEFQAGSAYLESNREALGSRRFVDVDAAGSIVGISLGDVSRGVSVQGLPQQRRVSQMLRRRDIQVIPPQKSR